MALPETSSTSEKKSETSKEKKEKPLTKVIIRRLPPTIDRETFLNQVSPVPDYNYCYLVKGDASLGENSFARVYINFICPEDVYSFKERFDNYVFLDNKGHEYPAVVEFASFQKIPKKRGKVRSDPKCGTIESDPIYLEFVESINKPLEQDEKPEYTLQLTSENKNDTTTPLLEYIKNKRAQRLRFREARREERKKREVDRKRGREDDRKRNIEEGARDKSPVKTVVKPQNKSPKEEKNTEEDTEIVDKEVEKQEVEEKSTRVFEKAPYYKNKEKKYEKYEDKRRDTRPKYSGYSDKREYKRGDDYRDYNRPKYDDYKKDKYEYKKEKFDDYKKDKYDDYRKDRYDDYRKDESKTYTKKVKKYSEKREERKMEAQKKLEQNKESNVDKPASENKIPATEKAKTDAAAKEPSEENATKSTEREKRDSDAKDQKRIRNKDRPALTIYRPGMLSKRKQSSEGEAESK